MAAPGAIGRPCLAAWRGGASLLTVAVVPGARRTGADGEHDGALRVRLVARPLQGQANAALLEWLAGELGLPRRAVTLHRGETSRRKQVVLDAAPERVAAWLDALLGSGSDAAAAR